MLIDVSRLIWRFWSRRLPTGIDRVCLAYLEHYGGRAQAMVQWRGRQMVLSPRMSTRLFAALLAGKGTSKWRLAALLAGAIAAARRARVARGALYLNVGHTGLDDPTLSDWIAAHGLRAIYMVHDLIPLTHPEYCRDGEMKRHERRMANMLASARGVIGNSQATLDALGAFATAIARPMPMSVAAWISGPPKSAATGTAPLNAAYFVTLGTIEGRKNHLLLLAVWKRMVAELGAAAPTLVIIGQRGWEAGPVLELLDRADTFEGKVVELNYCDDGQLADWIAGARALLMPSFVEGFGLPLIEALDLGTPVIASDLPVFREIAGSIPLFLDPRDEPAWERWIRAFVGDDPERVGQLKAIQVYHAPTWPEHFAIVDEWLARLS